MSHGRDRASRSNVVEGSGLKLKHAEHRASSPLCVASSDAPERCRRFWALAATEEFACSISPVVPRTEDRRQRRLHGLCRQREALVLRTHPQFWTLTATTSCISAISARAQIAKMIDDILL